MRTAQASFLPPNCQDCQMQLLNNQSCSVQPANGPVWSKVAVIKPQLEVIRCWQQGPCDLLPTLASGK